MKRLAKVLWLIPMIAMLLALAPMAIMAAEGADGWRLDSDGVQRYYKNGEKVTGVQEIGAFTYVFDDEGAYLGLYDAHTNVGRADTPLEPAYFDGLMEFKKNGGKIYAYHTFDYEDSYTANDFKTHVVSEGAFFDLSALEKKEMSSYYSTKIVDKDTGNELYKCTNRYQLVQRDTVFSAVKRGDGNAVQIISSSYGTTHSYANITLNHAMGEDIVIEQEFKLGEDFASANSIFQLIDRNNKDLVDAGKTGKDANYMPNVLSVNKDGGVYLSNNTGVMVAVLSENEYTRISVAIHPATNSFDVYVNGLLVYENAVFFKGGTYKAENFQIDEFRTTQFSNNPNTGSIYVDNFAAYNASAPVNTVTEGGRSGLYLEGSVLRYYRNNLIACGIASVTGTAGNYTFNSETLKFDANNGAYYPGNKADIIINGKVSSSSVAPGNVFIVPDAMEPDKGVFGGWKITDGATVTMVSPGEIYAMSGDITCTAVEMDLGVLDGASVKHTAAGSTSIRFMAKMPKAEYDGLIAIGAKVEAHMIVVPTEYFDKTYGYHTVEALKHAGYEDIIDITATSWYASNDNYYYYTASVDNIAPADFAKEYSAVAYTVITYANGTVNTVYSDYDDKQNSRSVYSIAHAAYNDRTTLKDQVGYANQIKSENITAFSPYSEEKLNVIKSFADKAIVLAASGNEIKADGDFYQAPYTVTTTFNSATGKNDIAVQPKNDSGWQLSDAVCVVYNGNKLGADEYKMEGICSLSVDAISYELSGLVPKVENVRSWIFLDPEFDSGDGRFTSVTAKEQYVHPEQEVGASFVWSYNDTPNFSISPRSVPRIGSVNNRHGAYNTYEESGAYYYNLSNWEAMSFWVWSDIENQTFYMNFGSENPDSDGGDYYGRLFTVKQGWNKFIVSKNEFSSSRTPLGWNKITGISFNTTGWSQTPNKENTLYFSELKMHDNSDIATPFTEPKFAEAAIFVNGGYFAGVDGSRVDIGDGDTETVSFIEDGIFYAPLASIAAVKGEGGIYYPEEGVLRFSYNEKVYIFEQGKKTYTVDGVKAETELTVAPVVSGRALFFSAEDVKSFFGYQHLYIDRMGMAVLSNTPDILDPDADYDTIYSLIETMIYVRPKGEQIVADLKEHSGGQHPYLMIDGEGFNKLRFYADMDTTLQGYIAKLEASYGIGTNKFTTPQSDVEDMEGYKKSTFTVGSQTFEVGVNRYLIYDGQRLLAISRDVMNKTIAWALLAKLYEVKDPERAEIYAERIWIELEAACNYIDPTTGMYSWHPQHFLDTGELGYPMGICYDWLYDYWVKTDANVDYEQYGYPEGTTRRQLMEDAIFWMGLSATDALPSDTTGKYTPYNYSLGGSGNNWNGVCNGGLMAAALAICNVERYADLVKVYLEQTVVGIESGMWVYAPEGGYEEGPGYWSYGTTYVHIFISCLNSACGKNYGLYNPPGLGHSVYFTTYLGSKNTTWGFHDGGSGSADTSIAAWFAQMDNDPNVNAIRRQAITNGWKGVSMYDIMYFDPHLMTSTITLELDAYYSLDTIMTFRSSWDADNSIFTGLHGGDNAASHGDLDIGNFVINVNGKFILCDLGSDSYNMPGYFGCYRWSYYRKRAEGQNTLVMIPSSTNTKDEGWIGKSGTPALKPGEEKKNTTAGTNLPTVDQINSAISKAKRYETGTNSALGVVDMAPAFTQMTEGSRGLYFKDGRSTIVLQDEAVFSENMDIWWFAHTQGEIEVSDDGRSAIISYGGVYLYAEIVTNMAADAKFTVMDAVSLDKNYTGWPVSTGFYTGDVEGDRSGFSKLTVRVDDTSELKLAVVFKVIEGPNAQPERGTLYQWTNIADWKVD